MVKPKRITSKKNERLRAPDVKIPLAQKNCQEYGKCYVDFLYFCKNYVKIHSVDEGLINFVPRQFQEEIYKEMEASRFLIAKIPRRYGKTAIVLAYFLWKIIFGNEIKVGIFADKAETAQKILLMLQTAYENLPIWMQKGVKVWNTEKIILDNGSQIDCGATTEASGRGGGYKYILLDEFAFVDFNIQSEFYRAVYPTIMSGDTTKLFIISTPNGMNLFHKIWDQSKKGKNSFKWIEVHWSALPGRDAAWAQEQIANMGQDSFDQEYGCVFGPAKIKVKKGDLILELPIEEFYETILCVSDN